MRNDKCGFVAYFTKIVSAPAPSLLDSKGFCLPFRMCSAVKDKLHFTDPYTEVWRLKVAAQSHTAKQMQS